MLPHVTIANAARDMCRIREALGEKKVCFVGASYGTCLGVVYTFAAAKPELGLGSTPQQVSAKFFDLAAKLDSKPALGMDGTLFRAATFGFLYRDEDIPALADLWKELDKDQSSARSAAAPPADNTTNGRLHVICSDSSWPKSVQSYQRDGAVDRLRHPLLGAASANIGPCAYWPSEPVEPQVRITDRGPSNVLLVQNERDPGTPLIGAQRLRRAFGDRARLVTVDQSGHGCTCSLRTGAATMPRTRSCSALSSRRATPPAPPSRRSRLAQRGWETGTTTIWERHTWAGRLTA